MPMDLQKVSLLCFGASYAVALLAELLQLVRPRRVQRWLRTAFTAAGLVAHSVFLAVQQPSLSSRSGSLLLLSWILAVFYLYGSLHYKRLAWGVFVLPVVLGLVALAGLFGLHAELGPAWSEGWMQGLDWDRFWGALHGALVLLSAVGICVAFVASVMYLVQARRLKEKKLPGQGLRMLSLERLEEMNRRAINLAFPLLTAGVAVGAALMAQEGAGVWLRGDPRMLGALGLWLVFAVLLYLRYAAHVPGRRLALLTIAAFALLVLTLAAPAHRFGSGGGP
jgi:ABC-type transport system involved in cytochrome c biogenesis permease subunit